LSRRTACGSPVPFRRALRGGRRSFKRRRTKEAEAESAGKPHQGSHCLEHGLFLFSTVSRKNSSETPLFPAGDNADPPGAMPCCKEPGEPAKKDPG
jgi:hypothetical protein